MKTNQRGFLQDADGNFSSMRLSFFILLIYALAAGSYVLVKEGSVLALAFITGIVTLTGALKLIQNNQEKEK